MNVWLVASAIFLVSMAPCALVAFRGDVGNRLVGLEMGAVVLTMMLVTLSQGLHRIPFYDVAVALALLAFGGALVFARFLERWL